MFRDKCEGEHCTNQSEYFCSKHDNVCCSDCSYIFHHRCQVKPLLGFSKVEEALRLLTDTIRQMEEYSNIYRLDEKVEGFKQELEEFMHRQFTIEGEVAKAKESHDFVKFADLREKIIQ